MRKRSLIVLGAIAILGLVALFLLDHYKTEMIHITIMTAVIQKAPPDYPKEQIRKRFDSVFWEAQESGKLDAYLGRLLALAQRLEKIQDLEGDQVDSLLESLDRDSQPAPTGGS